MSEAMKACPFCSNDMAIAMKSYPFGIDTVSATCLQCGAEGPSSGTREDAVAAWNRRAPDPAMVEVLGKVTP